MKFSRREWSVPSILVRGNEPCLKKLCKKSRFLVENGPSYRYQFEETTKFENFKNQLFRLKNFEEKVWKVKFSRREWTIPSILVRENEPSLKKKCKKSRFLVENGPSYRYQFEETTKSENFKNQLFRLKKRTVEISSMKRKFWKNCWKINILERRHLEENCSFLFHSSILFWKLYCKIVGTTTISSQSPISMFWKTGVKVRWISFLLKVNSLEKTQSFTWIFGRKDAAFCNLNFCWKTMITAF